MVAPAQMLSSSIQTTPAAMKKAVLDAATGGMSPTSKAKYIKYNCSDCGGDLVMAGDGRWVACHTTNNGPMDEAEARRSKSHMGAAE